MNVLTEIIYAADRANIARAYMACGQAFRAGNHKALEEAKKLRDMLQQLPPISEVE